MAKGIGNLFQRPKVIIISLIVLFSFFGYLIYTNFHHATLTTIVVFETKFVRGPAEDAHVFIGRVTKFAKESNAGYSRATIRYYADCGVGILGATVTFESDKIKQKDGE
jgi:hypothetical protein